MKSHVIFLTSQNEKYTILLKSRDIFYWWYLQKIYLTKNDCVNFSFVDFYHLISLYLRCFFAFVHWDLVTFHWVRISTQNCHAMTHTQKSREPISMSQIFCTKFPFQRYSKFSKTLIFFWPKFI